MEMHFYKRKPRKCPVCGSDKIADIMYGIPILSTELERDLKDEKIFLGGCEIYPDDPTWRCADCRTGFIRKFSSRNSAIDVIP